MAVRKLGKRKRTLIKSPVCMFKFYRKYGEEETLLFIVYRAAWERLWPQIIAHTTEIIIFPFV